MSSTQLTPAFESKNLDVFDCREDKSIAFKDVNLGPSHCFRKEDWNWLASGSGPRRAAERLAHTSLKMKVNVLMHETPNHRTGMGLIPQWEKVKADSAERRLDVVLTNNIAGMDNHITLTPWMILHRVVHCLSMSDFAKGDYLNCLVDAFHLAAGNGQTRGNENLLCILGERPREFVDFMKIIMTTRSARKGLLANDADVGAELFAQHHLGGIKFLRTKDWEARNPDIVIENRSGALWSKTIRKMWSTPEKTDAMLEKLEIQCGADLDRLTNDLVGHTVKF